MPRCFCVTFACSLALAMTCPLPARADDAATIGACLKSEYEAGRDAHVCIGRVSDPCLETPDAQSTVGMVDCINRETKIWDNLLNDEYGRLMKMLSAKAAEDVRKAQRIWITSRDADCAVPYEIFEGGTMAQPIAANCVLAHTANRMMQVRSWLEMVQPDQ